jgi:hypothetical protein
MGNILFCISATIFVDFLTSNQVLYADLYGMNIHGDFLGIPTLWLFNIAMV